MRNGLTALCLWVTVGMLGCDHNLSGVTLIGEPCGSSLECGAAGVCVTGQNGLCALPCDVSGDPNECPGGSYCDRESLASDTANKQDMTLCLPACLDQLDCRSGYDCKGVSGGNGKVCTPKK
jgi:hypothetical protein